MMQTMCYTPSSQSSHKFFNPCVHTKVLSMMDKLVWTNHCTRSINPYSIPVNPASSQKIKNWSVMGPSIRHLQYHEILLQSQLCLWYAVVVVVCTLQVTKFTHHLFQDWWWATLLFLKIIVKKSHVEHPSLSTVSLHNKLYYPQSFIHHVNSPCAAKLFLSPPTMTFWITPPCHYYTCAALDCVQSKHLHNTL